VSKFRLACANPINRARGVEFAARNDPLERIVE
jgi:hypothetical protein